MARTVGVNLYVRACLYLGVIFLEAPFPPGTRRSTAMALDVTDSVANAAKDLKSRGYVPTRRVKTGRRT